MDGLCILLATIHAGASHPSFDVRERFTLPEPSVAIFLVYSPDPEVRHRYAGVAEAEVYRIFMAPWEAVGIPWVDAFPDQPWAGCEIPMLQGDDWPGWKEATRLWVRGELRKGADQGELRAKMLVGWFRCQFWRKHGRYP